MVRISFCSSPLSPTAFRAAFMQLVRVESDTIRPPQTEAMRSSLLTNSVAVLHQVDQQVEHLRLDGNRFGTAVKLAPLGIEGVIGKAKLHVVAPVGLRGPSQRDNQAHLKEKSSPGQSLSLALPVSSLLLDRDLRGRNGTWESLMG